MAHASGNPPREILHSPRALEFMMTCQRQGSAAGLPHHCPACHLERVVCDEDLACRKPLAIRRANILHSPRKLVQDDC
jgi:hypothetical protein